MEANPIPLEDLIDAYADQKYGFGKTTAIIGSSLAIVSMISSSVLIWMIKRSRDGFRTTYHRIILGMSVADILYSLGLAHFNFASPSEDDYFIWNASGNQLSCSIQGFVTSLGAVGGLLCTCSLNLYSLAVVKYGKREEYIRRRLQPLFLGIPSAFALIINSTLLAKKNFNLGSGGNCYMAVYRPPHCIGYEDGQVREGFDIPCGRGSDGAMLFYYFSGYTTLLAVPIIIGVSLGSIYRSVLQQERIMRGYGESTIDIGREQENSDDRVSWLDVIRNMFRCLKRSPGQRSLSNRIRSSRVVLNRALAYSTAYLLSWSFFIAGTFFDLSGMEWPTFLWYLSEIFNPLQGVSQVLRFKK